MSTADTPDYAVPNTGGRSVSPAPKRFPARYSRVDPWVVSVDTAAEIAFLSTVFGAREVAGSRAINGNGTIGHVEVQLDDAVIMMFDSQPGWPATPAHLRVYVEDIRETMDRALSAGAREVTEPTAMPFGERVARLRDPQGHLWWLHEWVEDVPLDDLPARFATPEAEQAMVYVQRTLDAEMKGTR